MIAERVEISNIRQFGYYYLSQSCTLLAQRGKTYYINEVAMAACLKEADGLSYQ